MQTISQRINQYMATHLDMDVETIDRMRPHYWKEYGTTLRGLYIDHGIDRENYLHYVHDFAVESMLAPNMELERVLTQLPWRRVVFTSASREHAERVLAALGVQQCFERLFDVRDTDFACKPDPGAYARVLNALGASAAESIIFDDSLPNQRSAARLGMWTVLVGSTDRVDGLDFAIQRLEDAGEVARGITSCSWPQRSQ
jgi:putative hydrolase of the HAD superfamily